MPSCRCPPEVVVKSLARNEAHSSHLKGQGAPTRCQVRRSRLHIRLGAPLAQGQVRREGSDAAPRVAAQVGALREGALQRRLHRQQLCGRAGAEYAT